ncbi:hypothetical protein HYPSUDRAFT_58004 [Hypholoma sublateritium FD-334 SS-4]|uniref:Uncharacterized protein n=1 Tax=Hypholoma sublateritium (strain FD-334 SS-4) TaxID=945553 RepID=A0A0D2NCL3_HYPSF|nr:hypothetical protein HYPSUDRAFT_58004 [Hypholoma sublateritium FD-334 SS-4]
MAVAAAPAHYIRTIHTSFTAAHPRSAHAAPAAWAVRAAPKDREHAPHPHPHHHQYQQQPLQVPAYPAQPVSISTHNAHYYTHHLQAPAPPNSPSAVPVRRRAGAPAAAAGAGPSPAGAGGRRRSVSIRMPPTYAPASRGRPAGAQGYKFDPFADDEAPAAPLSVTSPLSGGFAANRQQAPAYGSGNAAPYTIHIPAAQPTEIEQYTPAPPARSARPARLRSLIPINGPLPGTAPTTLSSTTTLSTTTTTRPSSPPPAPSARTTLTRSPSPPTSTPTRMSAPPQAPNLSKIVAGILLNRVHAVGKPMRRRVLAGGAGAGAAGYRKSCLSSVISVEL